MDKKQIDEMSAEIQKAVNGCSSYWSGLIAAHLYDQGYRKQKTVAKRINGKRVRVFIK